jgi:hypothetical protein
MEVLNMAKKIIMGVLFLGLVGALAVGAVNRTVAKSADTNNTEQRGAGWARTQEDGTVLAANVEGRGGRNQATADETHAAGQGGQGQRQPLNTQQGSGRDGQAAGSQGNQARGNSSQDPGGNGQGQAGASQGEPQVLAASEDHQWTAVSGIVLSIDDTQMTLQTDSGEIVIADRPWSFALESGFTAQVGDQVTVQGFYEGATFEAGQLANGDLIVSIREESGRPLWAGGRGGGQGRTG